MLIDDELAAALNDRLTKIRRNSNSVVPNVDAARNRLGYDVEWADQALVLIRDAARPQVEPEPQEPPPPPQSEAVLLWEDTFAGPAGSRPNPAIWNLQTGPRWENGTIDACMTSRPENVCLDGDGHLVLTARREQYTMNGITKPYTSARIDTQGKRSLVTGYIACSAKVETTSGSWPAWWTWGGPPWPGTGEIDIYEVFGDSDRPAHHIHIPGADDGRTAPAIPDMASTFHEYGVEIVGTEAVVFYVDRKETFRVERKGTWPFGTRAQFALFYINVGSWGGDPAAGTWPVRQTIDWVRAWDRRPW